MRRGRVAFDSDPAGETHARPGVEAVEQVERDRVGAALGSRARRHDVHADDRAEDVRVVHIDGRTGADAAQRGRRLLFAHHLEAHLRSCRIAPVCGRATRLVWLEKMSLWRSFACRLRETRFVSGL